MNPLNNLVCCARSGTETGDVSVVVSAAAGDVVVVSAAVVVAVVAVTSPAVVVAAEAGAPPLFCVHPESSITKAVNSVIAVLDLMINISFHKSDKNPPGCLSEQRQKAQAFANISEIYKIFAVLHKPDRQRTLLSVYCDSFAYLFTFIIL
jgi:hypothetical protein